MKLSNFKSTRIVFCVPENQFLDFDDKSGDFTGPAGYLFTAYFKIVSNLFNATVKIPKGLGGIRDPKSATMPGCFGLLQRGEADINMYPFEMPVIGIENVTQINVTGVQSSIHILSPYSVKESHGTVALGPLDSFGSVSASVWSLVGLTFMTFTCLLLLVRHLSRVTRRREEGLQGQSALYQVATHLIRHQSCNFSGDTARFIAILMSSFTLFFITIFSSMMASEKVSTGTVFTYDSYEKIHSNPDVQPVWFQNFDDYAQYMRAPVGSPRHKLWTQSLAISQANKSRTGVVPFDEAKLAVLPELLRRKQVVFFVTEIVAKLMNGALCNVVFSTAEGYEAHKDQRYKITLDTEASQSMFVLPVSRHSPRAVIGAMEPILSRVIECALFYQPDLSIASEQLLAKDISRAKIIYNDERAQCMDFEKLPIHEPEVVPLLLATAGQLFTWWATGCALSAVIFSIESMYHKVQPNRAHRKHRKPRRSNRITQHPPPRPPAVTVSVHP